MTINMTRRAMLAATPAAGMAMMATPSLADQDPLPDYVEEWLKARAAFENERSEDEEVHDALYAKMEEIEWRILTTKATSAAGMVAQLEYALTDDLIGAELHGSFEGLDGQMFRGMIEALKTGVAA